MQIKKNPRDQHADDDRDLYGDTSETGLNAIPTFTDEPQRPSWRRDPAFTTTPIERPSAPAAEIPVPAPVAPVSVAPRTESVVDANSSFDGRYETGQDLRVMGSVSGEIICQGQLTIERDATAKAKIQAREIIVRGRTEGEITCSGKLVLESTASVSGKVRAATLVVHEGAALSGNIETAAETTVSAAPARATRREVPGVGEESPIEAPAAVRGSRGRDLPSFALVSSDDRVAAERSPAPAR